MEPPVPPPFVPEPGPRHNTLLGLAVAAVSLLLLVLTGPSLAIVWDEGYTLGREQRVRWWFEAMADPPAFAASWHGPGRELVQPDRLPTPRADQIDTRAKLLDRDVIAWFWPFGREEPHGHPPFYAIVGMIGDVLAPGWPTLERARLGPMIAFSLATGLVFASCRKRWGTWAGAIGAGALLLQPRLFAHAHYATYDGLLTALWVCGTIAFARAVEARDDGPPSRLRWGPIVAFGILCGFAADTKLTGWFLPLPCLAWAALRLDRRALLTLLAAAPIAILTLYMFNPPWWPDPLGGVAAFFQSNLTRGRTIPIETMFLGRVYRTPIDSLPWFNTLAWVVFVVPVGVLVMALIGATRAAASARSDPDALPSLALLHALFLLTLRALPHTPGHDGERQFLAAFGMIALLAGAGAGWVVRRRPRDGRAIVLLPLIEAAVSVIAMMPVPLSYYAPQVGGPPGASRLGMEPTYYWDGLTPDAIDWLNRNTPDGSSVMFATNPTSWMYLRDAGTIKVPVAPFDQSTGPKWLVVQNRTGSLRPVEKALIARIGPSHVISQTMGVPLVWAFPWLEYEVEAMNQATTRGGQR
jgi:4-amino-4-deoxy-L-arabinose transferase-like glycosyltransferase